MFKSTLNESVLLIFVSVSYQDLIHLISNKDKLVYRQTDNIII